MTEQERTQSTRDDWREVAFSLVANAIRQSSANIIHTIREYIDKAVHAVIKSIVITFLMLVGAVFVLIGAAQHVGTLLGMSAYGYYVVGGVVLIVAGLMHFARKE